jgi:predicted nucleotidyltransferase
MRFCATLDDICGHRIERVVLFGSHARGDARPDSNYATDCEMLDGFDLDVH